jgi:hypothetical protein
MNRRLKIRSPSQDKWRAVLIAACSLGFVAALGALLLLNRDPAVDTATLCPQSAPLQTSVVVLVDTTDPLTTAQSSALTDEVTSLADSIPKYAKLTLLFLDSNNPYQPKQLVSLCNPGSSKGANPLFHTLAHLQVRWQTSFGEPVQKAIASLLSAPTSMKSPIIEAITGATWRADFKASVPHRELIVVSDLLQNDPGDFSAYKRGDLWRRFQTSGIAHDAVPNLAGVEIHVVLLHRDTALRFQTKKLIDFWQRWFTEHGAASLDFGDTGPAQRTTGPQVAMGQG